MRGIIQALLLAAGCLIINHGSAATAPALAVIEDTYISAPRLIGNYALMSSVNYSDQGKLMAGVGFRYHAMQQPWLNTDIYVYPGGDSESIEHAEKNFRATVKMAAQLGVYSNIEWGESRPYDLLHEQTQWHGRVISMRVRTKGGESASRTYLFHQGLYDYKVRLNVPVAEADVLPTEADKWVETLLPLISTVSIGSCGNQQLIKVLGNGAPMPAGYVDGVSPDGFGIALHRADLQSPATSGSAAHAMIDSPLAQRILLAKQRQID